MQLSGDETVGEIQDMVKNRYSDVLKSSLVCL